MTRRQGTDTPKRDDERWRIAQQGIVMDPEGAIGRVRAARMADRPEQS